MLIVKELREEIRKALTQFETYVKCSVSQDMTDINRYAEDFYCGLLNCAFGWDLRNLNQDNRNQPAIDLADDTNEIAVQVTSSTDRSKVTGTLKKFFEKKQDLKYKTLLMLVIGKEDPFQKDFTLEREFDFDPERDIWDTPRLLGRLESITDVDRLQAICDYLQKHFSTYPLPAQQYPNLPLRTVLERDAFVGRRGELEEIDRRFRAQKVVFLSGLGGMGKTELAVRYAQEFVQDQGRQAFQVLFSGDFRQTILNNVAPNVPGLDTRNLPENEIYGKTLEALNSCGPDALLILDNADQANLMELRGDLGALKMRVLITTRQEEPDAVDVARLHRQELHQLFTQHRAKVTPEEMDKLIDAVDGHTLTVDLMARALRPGFRAATAEKLLKNLADSSVKKVPSAYRGTADQARINEHLRTVFRVVNLSEREQVLLHFATLLPENGMDPELFLQPFEEDLGDDLEELIRSGWLLWKEDLLRIHPVIRLVCIEELKPTVENCRSFLHWFRGQYDETTYDREKFAQIAALYENASHVLGETGGFWACEAGYLWNVLVETKRAESCNLRAVDILEQNAPGSLVLASAYNNLSGTYVHLGDHEEAQKYNLKALAIFEQVLPPTDPNLATSYNNVGFTYGALGEHKKALEYKLKALKIKEQVLPSTHPDLALSYNNVGFTYGHLGDHEKALEYKLKALAIWEQVLMPTHPDLAASYNNVGSTYGHLGDREKALEYQLKALAIREQVLSPTHPNLAASYNNVGSTYGHLGDHEKALEYQLKALAIREQVLPPTHPDLARSYNNVGGTYGHLGDREKALEYQLKALAIWEQSLPEDHPDNVLCRSNIACSYARMEDFIRASEYMDRALDSAERSMKGHPNLEMYRWAAKELARCARCQEWGEPFDNPFQ